MIKNGRGNWMAFYSRPDRNPECPELQQFTIEMTTDYRVVSVYLGADNHSLSWVKKPSVTTYAPGAPLKVDGASLRVSYASGAHWDVPLTADMVRGYNPAKLGIQTLQVVHEGDSLEFQVTVEAPSARTTTTTAAATVSRPVGTTASAASSSEPTPAVSSSSVPSHSSPSENSSDKTTDVTLPAIQDEESDVTVSGDLPTGTRLQVAVVKNGESFKKVEGQLPEHAKNFTVLDINLTDLDHTKIQPDGTVQVTVPIPRTYGKHLAVYRLEADGSITLLESRIEGDTIVFTTDHFSIYTIVDLPEQVPADSPDGLSVGGRIALLTGVAIVLVSVGLSLFVFLKRKHHVAE